MQSKSSLSIFFCLLQIFFCSHTALAQNKIFKLIQSGEYEKAKSSLFKSLAKKNDDVVLNYDAAWYYFMEDHAAFKPDSAWYHIVTCGTLLLKNTNQKQLAKFSSQGIRPYTVTQLQNNIEKRAYEIADSNNTVESWEYFIKKFPGAKKHPEAVEKRNAMAFNAAKENFSYESFKDFMQKYPNAAQLTEAKNLYESLLYKTLTHAKTWQAFKDFFEKHPESPYADEARANYEKLLFEEVCRQGNLESYIVFVKQYPENRFVPQAEDSIYALFINNGSLENYEQFVIQQLNNKNIKTAWLNLYHLATANFTVSEIETFDKNYSSFPYRELLLRENFLATLHLMPVEVEDKTGFMDTISKTLRFKGDYVEALGFSGRYAAVLKDTLWGYVDRDGNMSIAPRYNEANDFINGFAVVGKGNCLEGECMYGIINQSGREILPIAYEEVYDFTTDGLALVKHNEKGYGYVNRAGKFSIPLQFDDASDFSQGMAAVKKDLHWGFIDASGNVVIPFQFSKAGNFGESIAPVADSTGLWGYINTTGKWVIAPKFHFANSFENGKAYVQIKEKNKKGIEITLEKTIDKTGAFIVESKPKNSPYKKGKKK
jgi:hypothetical protein